MLGSSTHTAKITALLDERVVSEGECEANLVNAGGLRTRSNVISHKVFFKSFCNSQFPHKSVNLFCISVLVKDKHLFPTQEVQEGPLVSAGM